MKTRNQKCRVASLLMAGALACTFLLLTSADASAQIHGHGGHGFGHSSHFYHQPSFHYDRVYHPTRVHWTPGRGLHTDGHYDYRRHYTPGFSPHGSHGGHGW